MYEKLLKVTTVLTCLLSSVAIGMMLHFAAVKTIVIAEDVTAGAGIEQLADQELTIRSDHKSGAYLHIPLSEGIRPDDIVIENRYIDHVINIIITGAAEAYYEDHELYGNTEKIAGCNYHEKDGITTIQFQMNGLYEHKYVFENNSLYLEFVQPRDMYDKIIVIDAAHGGEDYGSSIQGVTEKDITLDIVGRLRTRLEESDIRTYYTRVEDTNPDVKRRAQLANQATADLLISVHVNADDSDLAAYGTLTRYNPYYVIPQFGNIELADLLERQVVEAIDGRAIGLAEMEPQDILSYAKVPAASIEVGYLTNAADAALLESEEYREKIAEGIYRAILEAYGQMERNQ